MPDFDLVDISPNTTDGLFLKIQHSKYPVIAELSLCFKAFNI
jgi:hypothetical protein